jgi:threonine aldolase
MDLRQYEISRDLIRSTVNNSTPQFSSPELSNFVRDSFSRNDFVRRQDDTAISLWNDMYARTLNVFKHIILEHLNIPNNGYLLGKSTRLAQLVFNQYFGSGMDTSDVSVVFSTTGTAANRLCTSPFLDGNTAIITTSKAHLVEREGRSSESQTGSSVYVIPLGHEPLTAKKLAEFIENRKQYSPITQKPKIFSLTNPEEDGYVYSLKELKEIAAVVHEHGMLFHIDGARLFQAAAALQMSLREISTEADVDTLALGGSKVGLYMANASVFLPSFFSYGYQQRLHNFSQPQELFDHLRGHMKRGGLLAGQSEAMASQFLVGLHDNLLIELGAIANQNARYLAQALIHIDGCSLIHPVQSNVALMSVPKTAYQNLLRHFDGVKVWNTTDPKNDKNIILRFITSATMDIDTIDKVASHIEGCIHEQMH